MPLATFMCIGNGFDDHRYREKYMASDFGAVPSLNGLLFSGDSEITSPPECIASQVNRPRVISRRA